jgi:hypothetical protein
MAKTHATPMQRQLTHTGQPLGPSINTVPLTILLLSNKYNYENTSDLNLSCIIGRM